MVQLLFLTMTAALLAAPVPAPQTSQPAKPPSAPAGWAAAVEKDSALGIEGKYKEQVAILEGWVKRHPTFPDAHARLGAAYESLGRDLVATQVSENVASGRKYLEVAATHFARALDLGGDVHRAITIRALADLLSDHPFGLSRPAERAAFVRDVVKRFPQEARAHVELLRLLIQTRSLDDAEAAFAAARDVVERTADARAELAEGIWPDLKTVRDSPAQARLIAHSLAVLDEALKIDSEHYFASAQKEEILRALAQRSKDPAQVRALLREADRLRDRRMR